MNGIVITWTQLLYVSLVLILFYTAELLLFLRKSSRSGGGQDLKKLLAEQQDSLVDLQREIETVKVRLSALQVQVPKPDSIPITPVDLNSENSPYSQAIRLAQLGSDADEVATKCGISRGEADLIVALYRTGTLH